MTRDGFPDLLQANVCQSVLSKDTLGIKVGGQETTLAAERMFWCQAGHVGRLHNVLQVFHEIRDVRVDVDLVLPLELGPHRTELSLGALSRHNVVHDI